MSNSANHTVSLWHPGFFEPWADDVGFPPLKMMGVYLPNHRMGGLTRLTGTSIACLLLKMRLCYDLVNCFGEKSVFHIMSNEVENINSSLTFVDVAFKSCSPASQCQGLFYQDLKLRNRS